MVIYQSMCILLVCGLVHGHSVLTEPKALTVNCQSLGNKEEFKQRLKWRQNAEDQSTIWLFKGEQLNIHFELKRDTDIEVMGVVYSNDGDWDLLSVNLDGQEIGHFRTVTWHDWGHHWNEFESSGPVGGTNRIGAGKHDITLRIEEADAYGIEIDYIRLNVHGAKIEQFGQDDFLCLHKPTADPFGHPL